MLVSNKSTGQTVVNGASSNVTYSFVSKVACYDLYIMIKNYKSLGFPIDYMSIRGMQVQDVIFPGSMFIIPKNREFSFLNFVISNVSISQSHLKVNRHLKSCMATVYTIANNYARHLAPLLHT